MRRDRLEFFSDAVLAVAITLMVLRINPPDIPPGQSEWQSFSNDVLPLITFYLITFAVIVRLWRRHHDIFEAMPERATSNQVFLNMAFLASVCLLPFGLEYYSTTAPVSVFSTAVYAVALSLSTVLLGFLGWSVSRRVPWHSFQIAVVFLLALPLVPLMGSWAILVWLLDFPLGWWWDHRGVADSP